MQLQCSARSKQPGRGQHREGSAQQGERCITLVAPPAMARAPVTSPMALRSAWRRGSGAAVLCSPRTNVFICPHRDARRPLPYANFGPVSYVQIAYLSFAYPPHIINSRIYDVGINCHKYVKYVDSRTALLWCYDTEGADGEWFAVSFRGVTAVKANPNPAPATRKPGTRGNPREICLQKPGPDRAQRHPRGPAAARASGLGPGFCCCARARGCSQCAAAQPAGCGCCAARGSSRRPCVPSRTEVAP